MTPGRPCPLHNEIDEKRDAKDDCIKRVATDLQPVTTIYLQRLASLTYLEYFKKLPTTGTPGVTRLQ